MLRLLPTVKAFCAYPFQRLKFTPEGDVTMCCFHERKCLGNILKQDLMEIWNSPLAQEIRQETMAGQMHRTCRGDSCPLYHKMERPMFDVQTYQFPFEFEIDIPTQHCNVGGEHPTKKNPACLMCERHLRRFEDFWQDDHLEEVCQRLQPYIKHIHWLHIQGVAEPFWKDRIFQLLDLLGVEKYKHKVWISTTTNGTLMNERHRKLFLHYPKSTITWSMDAGSPLIYKIIRRLDMYDKIVENLKTYCQERNSNGQHVHIHNNINTINIGDVEKMVELAAEAGIDRLDFNATYGVPAICVNKENVHIFREAQKRIMFLSKKLGVFTTFMRDFTLDIEPAPTWDEVVRDFGEPEVVEKKVWSPPQAPETKKVVSLPVIQ